MGPRVAAFNFDSPDVDIVAREIAAGRMPNLAALVERGRAMAIRDAQELLTSASSPTLAHACSPALHQLVYPVLLEPGTYKFALVTADSGGQPPFWRHLSDAGRRSVIVSPYGAGFQERLLGAQVIGWGTHDACARSVARSDPPDLAGELERRFGPRTIRYGEPPPRTAAEQRDYIRRMVLGCRQQAEATRWLAETQEWDFLFGFFADCHQAGHYLWHLTTPGGDDPGPVEPDLADGLPAIYRAVDEALGHVIEALPAETVTLVVNATSMGTHHGLGEAVDPVLERAGWLVRSPDAPLSPRQRALGLARRAVQRAVPAAARPALARLVPRDRLVGELSLAGVDWSRSRAFQLPSDGSAMVRLNVAGREPEGTIRPGAEYEEACAELRELFTSLRVVGSGEPAALEVRTCEEVLGVPATGPLPDLCIAWAPHRDVHAVNAPRLGTIEFPRGDPRKSLHWAPGFAVAAGPGVTPSGATTLDGPAIRLSDVGATVLDVLGVPLPPTFDGTPIPMERGARAGTP